MKTSPEDVKVQRHHSLLALISLKVHSHGHSKLFEVIFGGKKLKWGMLNAIFPEKTIEQEFAFLSKVLIASIFQIMDISTVSNQPVTPIIYVPFYYTD